MPCPAAYCFVSTTASYRQLKAINMGRIMIGLAAATLLTVVIAVCSPAEFKTNQECIDNCGQTFVYDTQSCPSRNGCVGHAPNATACAVLMTG
jgi:hypothetical protein